MKFTHTPLRFADHTLHLVAFEPDTFHDRDLLWLPHHVQLAHAGRKRKAEHLAGRIAAVYALREVGHKQVPEIGEQRQPLWPDGLSGSISHSATTALAVVSRQPVGIDIETLFTPQTAIEVCSSLVDQDEEQILRACALPFPLALTLAFSAKESVFKALSRWALSRPGFASAKVTALTATQLTLRLLPEFSPNFAHHEVNVFWMRLQDAVITLFPPPCTEQR
ncbi:enterobactin synthase subunit EntD [Citrobacter amalonaticus]|uniref:enterobactin synthase subunit EntD n=1 Tax=Citrobacter amalonaticus TaxID=35703 RepID=UPI00300C4E33